MKLLFATDGSPEARAAARAAAALPLAPPVEVVVVHALEPLWLASEESLQSARAAADEILDLGTAVFRADRVEWKARSRRVEAYPVPGIVKAAEQEDADLVVIGTRGLSALESFLEGSPVEPVVERAPCPVLVGPKRGYEPAAADRVLIAIADGPFADAIPSWLAALPLPASTEVHLVGVIEGDPTRFGWASAMPYRAYCEAIDAEERRGTTILDRAAQPLEARGISVSRHLRCGVPATEILAVAADLKPSLLVVGAHRSGRHLTGRISRLVVRHAPCPVLVHRPKRAPRVAAAKPPARNEASPA